VRLRIVGLSLLLAAGCASAALQIYPHPPGEPGTDLPPDHSGVRCADPGSSCVDIAVGSGEAMRRFALVTARVTVDDLIEPPVRSGPHEVKFLEPLLGPIPFRGRDRDLSVNMLGDANANRVGGQAFFERDAQALVGTWTVGMKRGGVREIRGRYTGRLAGRDLPGGRDRRIQLELLDFCYPVIGLHSRGHWQLFDGSDFLQPALVVSGCE
jgi:hypothetical protein